MGYRLKFVWLFLGRGQEYDCSRSKNMRKAVQTALWMVVVVAGAVLQAQDKPEIASANTNLVPQDFTVDDVPISIKIPFTVFLNGKEWQGHTIGWHISAVLHPNTAGSTMWFGLPGRGMYILSLVLLCYKTTM